MITKAEVQKKFKKAIFKEPKSFKPETKSFLIFFFELEQNKRILCIAPENTVEVEEGWYLLPSDLASELKEHMAGNPALLPDDIKQMSLKKDNIPFFRIPVTYFTNLSTVKWEQLSDEIDPTLPQMEFEEPAPLEPVTVDFQQQQAFIPQNEVKRKEAYELLLDRLNKVDYAAKIKLLKEVSMFPAGTIAANLETLLDTFENSTNDEYIEVIGKILDNFIILTQLKHETIK